MGGRRRRRGRMRGRRPISMARERERFFLSTPPDPISMASATPPPISPQLARPSPSFRLRSSSLNSLRLRRVFDLFDRNGDAEITVEEICQALDRLGLGVDPAELSSTVAAYIRLGAAGLAFDNFQSLHRALGDALFGDPPSSAAGEAADEEDMREAFNVFDDNGDGRHPFSLSHISTPPSVDRQRRRERRRQIGMPAREEEKKLRRRRMREEVDERTEGILASWSRRMGLRGGQRCVGVAAHVLGSCPGVVAVLPFRVALAAALWFAAKLSEVAEGTGGAATGGAVTCLRAPHP